MNEMPETNSTDQIFPQTSGTFVIAGVRPRYAAAIEVITHSSAHVMPYSGSSAVISAPIADTLYCAYYSREVLANGWEPCDQPSASAYLPFRFSFLRQVDLPNGGKFLIQRHAFREPVWRTIVTDDPETHVVSVADGDTHALSLVLAEVLQAAGVPRETIAKCTLAVSESLTAAN